MVGFGEKARSEIGYYGRVGYGLCEEAGPYRLSVLVKECVW